MIKHYVEFFYQGALDTETEVQEIKDRRLSRSEIPGSCFGYRFFDRQEAVDGKTIVENPQNYSGMTYFGRAMTLAEVKREMPDARLLISNMENPALGWDRVVKTRHGNVRPLRLEDRVFEFLSFHF